MATVASITVRVEYITPGDKIRGGKDKETYEGKATVTFPIVGKAISPFAYNVERQEDQLELISKHAEVNKFLTAHVKKAVNDYKEDFAIEFDIDPTSDTMQIMSGVEEVKVSERKKVAKVESTFDFKKATSSKKK